MLLACQKMVLEASASIPASRTSVDDLIMRNVLRCCMLGAQERLNPCWQDQPTKSMILVNSFFSSEKKNDVPCYFPCGLQNWVAITNLMYHQGFQAIEICVWTRSTILCCTIKCIGGLAVGVLWVPSGIQLGFCHAIFTAGSFAHRPRKEILGQFQMAN